MDREPEPGASWPGLRRVFRLPANQRRVHDEVSDELWFHIQERVEELMDKGLSREQAEAEVRKRFGDVTRVAYDLERIDERAVRERGRAERLSAFGREVRHAARMLLRTPAFSVIALITLALGIGATTAIFTVLDAVVLRPLPYPESDRLVSVMHPVSGAGVEAGKWGTSVAGYFYFRRENRTLSDLGVYQTGRVSVAGDGEAERVRAAYVTSSLLTTLRARPAVGRLITPEDDRPGVARVVVLGYDFWARRYGSDPGVVSRMIEVEGRPMQVVGVAAGGLNLPRPGAFASNADLAGFGVDLWFPLRLDPDARAINEHTYTGVGRLKPGVTPEAAERDLAQLTARLPELFPNAYSPSFMREYNFGMSVIPLRDEVLGNNVARALWILFGAVGLVLLIACANVSNLFLVRMEARRHEAAIRAALGAGRGQIATHYLAESLLLALVAGALGLALAQAATRALLAVAPTNIPRLSEVHLGWTAGGFAALISLVAGVAFGLFPLLRGVDTRPLREGSHGLTPSRPQRVVRNGLVISQVALALVLLAAAGLMVRSFARLRDVRPGLDPRGVLVFEVAAPVARYRTYDDVTAFQRQLHARLGALPGVQSVGATTHLPLQGFTGCAVVFVEGRWPLRPGEVPPCVSTPRVTPGFFRTLGIQVRGRAPDWSDIDAGTGAVVVTRALAERLWPGEDAIGKGINSNGGTVSNYYRVVGVVDELRAGGLEKPPTEAVFYPVRALPKTWLWEPARIMTVAVRTNLTRPAALTRAIRRAVTDLEPRVALANVRTMEEVVERSMARASFLMLLLGTAAGMALVLSAVGIYGVISYIVGQRRAEIGIRMALGARVSQVGRLVVLQSLRLAVIGVALGLIGALAGTRALRALLFEVSPTDPVVLVIVSAVLVFLAALASYAPARRAARVDPVEALRAQ
jgi:putative ABC transport system permease protein